MTQLKERIQNAIKNQVANPDNEPTVFIYLIDYDLVDDADSSYFKRAVFIGIDTNNRNYLSQVRYFSNILNEPWVNKIRGYGNEYIDNVAPRRVAIDTENNLDEYTSKADAVCLIDFDEDLGEVLYKRGNTSNIDRSLIAGDMFAKVAEQQRNDKVDKLIKEIETLPIEDLESLL